MLLSKSLQKPTLMSTGDTTITNNIDYEDMEHLVDAFKKLVLISDHSERIRLLTLCPPSWSRREISKHFSVSEWESRMAIELRESNGILSVYENNQDRGQISPLTINAVLDFYEGIRSYHHFEPVDSTTIRCKTTSNAVLYKDSSISRQNESQLKYVKRVLTIEDVKLNNYIVVEYQDSWWLAVVKDIEVNLQELHVTFLHPPGPRTSFQFPTKSDELKIELGNVICLLHEAPRLSARNTCSITQELFEEIQQIFSEN
ncbi:unnamed protein product [Rotaria sp. Silwood1]|nr:unnamed protein product [Rotaria sp. Silwood1]